jgi:hypothetical protein
MRQQRHRGERRVADASLKPADERTPNVRALGESFLAHASR